MTNVYCYAEKVPNTVYNVFNNSSIESATLHIPNRSIHLYKKSTPWSKFRKFAGLYGKEYTLSYMIDGMVLNEELRVKNEESAGTVYDLSGRKINSQLPPVNSQLRKGINIIRYSDGTTKKVLVK